MQLFQSIHDALERHLPSIGEESDRQEILKYLRGLKSVLATRADMAEPNVIHFGNNPTRRRFARAIAAIRSRQIAEARRLHQRALDGFSCEMSDFVQFRN
jgi:hypothetical protein